MTQIKARPARGGTQDGPQASVGAHCAPGYTSPATNNIDISPKQFVKTTTSPSNTQRLTRDLREHGMEPGTAFQKDTTLVRYAKIRIEFDSGLVLVGTGHDVNEHVRIRSDNEPPGAEVNDIITTVAGR